MSTQVRRWSAGLLLAGLLGACAGAGYGEPSGAPPERDLIGTWINTVDRSRIEIQAPEKGKLRVLGKNGREWKAVYVDGTLRLTRTPTAEEINPAVPEWARKDARVAGHLVWRAELKASNDEDGYRLDGNLLPGEVHWTQKNDLDTGEPIRRDAGLATGQGQPIPLHYSKSEDWHVADTFVVSSAVGKKPGDLSHFTLFAYGPHVPHQWPISRPVKSRDTHVEYQVLGAADDLQKGIGGLRKAWTAGWKLAKDRVNPKDAERFSSWSALVLDAKVQGDVLPGYKRYSLANVQGGWSLGQGTARAELRIIRPLPPDPGSKSEPFEPTTALYFGERVRAEIRTDPPVDTPVVQLVIGAAGTWQVGGQGITAAASRVKDEPGVFRTDPILLVPAAQDFMSGSDGPTVCGVASGHSFQVRMADPLEFMMSSPASQATVDIAPAETLWIRALRRAAAAAGIKDIPEDTWRKLAQQTALTVETRAYTEIIFKIGLAAGSTPLSRYLERKYGVRLGKGDAVVRDKITLGDHAATILLRDEFVGAMEALVAGLESYKTREQKLEFMRSWSDKIADERFAPRNLVVKGPVDDYIFVDGKKKEIRRGYPLHVFYPGGFVKDRPVKELGHYDLVNHAPWTEVRTEADRTKVIEDALLEGFDLYKDYAARSLAKGKSIPDTDVAGLLELTGHGFKAIVESLLPKLMRPNRSGGGMAWEPDQDARMHVRTINETWDLVEARKAWSEADTAMDLTLASFIPYLIPHTAVRVGMLALNLAINVHAGYNAISEQVRSEEERAFGLGAIEVVGSDRFNMAVAQQTPAWVVMVNMLIAGYGLSNDVPQLMASFQRGEAMPVAWVLAHDVNQSGTGALTRAPPREQAAFFAAGSALEAESAAGGGKQLSGNLEEIRDAMARVEKEAAKPPPSTPRLSELDLLPQRGPSTLARPSVCEPLPYSIVESGGKAYVFYDKNKTIFKIVKKLGNGSYFTAYAIEDSKWVLKICKHIDVKGRDTLSGIVTGQEVLEGAGFRVLQMQDSGSAGRLYYYIQERIPQGASEAYKVAENGRFAMDAREAIEELFGKMLKKKIFSDDLHTANIFLERKPGTLASVGILDPDRTAYWERLTPTLREAVEDLGKEPGQFAAWNPLTRSSQIGPIQSIVGSSRNPIRIDLEDAWLATLEKHGYIHFENGRFTDGMLSVDGLEKAGFTTIKTRGQIDVSHAPIPRPMMLRPTPKRLASVWPLPPVRPAWQPAMWAAIKPQVGAAAGMARP